jgi:hypothetical protein
MCSEPGIPRKILAYSGCRRVPQAKADRTIYDFFPSRGNNSVKYLIEMGDNSMVPEFLPGDILLMRVIDFNLRKATEFNQRICEVHTPRGPLIRRVEVRPDFRFEGSYGLWLTPANRRYKEDVWVGSGEEIYSEFLEVRQRAATIGGKPIS